MSQLVSVPPVAGVQHEGQGMVKFVLFAPGKKQVQLIGSFNDWSNTADSLQPADDGWWELRKQLDAGEHYYQFIVDGVTICDPYARCVIDAEPQSAPEGAADEDAADPPPLAVLQIGGETFDWRHDDFQRPNFADLVIYEMRLEDFTAEGTFDAAVEKLDYLQGLGVNAIELMPITEAALDEGWGYQPTYYFSVRRDLGTSHQCKRFIDEAHRRGLAVILDIVLAHSAPTHPFNKLYKYDQSPWYGEGIGGKNNFGLPNFDHRKPATAAFARDVQRYWLDEYHIDGFRYDYAANIGIDGDNGLKRLSNDARAQRADSYLIGEYIPEDPKIVGLVAVNATWHLRLSHAFKCLALRHEYGEYKFDDFENVIRALEPEHQGYQSSNHMINYVESHDEHRLAHELLDQQIARGAAADRLMLIATVLLTTAGVPMIYQGQEWGEDTVRIINQRNPLRWPLAQTNHGEQLLKHYRVLLHLRRQHPAFRAKGMKIESLNADEKWVVFHRWNEHGDEAVIAVNFSDEKHELHVSLPKPGGWRDALSDRIIERGEDDTVKVELDGVTAMVLLPAKAESSS